MWSSIGKAALAASFVALTPAASILSGGQAQAHSDVYVSGSVAVGFPSLVVGFSYGDPFAVGHVHYSPVHCAVGPLYYYPTYGVYTHYYPQYHYSYYPRPYSHHDVHVYHHGGYGHGYGHGGGYGYGGHSYRGHSPKYARGPVYVRHSNGNGWHGDRRSSSNGSGHKGSGHKGKSRHDSGRDGGRRGNGTRGHHD